MTKLLRLAACRLWAAANGIDGFAASYSTSIESNDAQINWAWGVTGWRRYALGALVVFWGILLVNEMGVALR